MASLLSAMEGAAIQGILWGILAVGVFLTFRVLDFPDLTVEGSFAVGGSVAAILITKGMNPFVVLLFSMLSGMVAGVVTGLLHTVLKIPGILAGILTMIACYSINIRIMGQANTSLIKQLKFTDIMNSMISKLLPNVSAAQITSISSALVGIAITLLIILVLYLFFGTEIGAAIRATGNNESMVRALGVNTDTMKVLGLLLSNGLVALSGGLVAQQQGYADVQMGVGAIVIGLASVIIGEVVFCHKDHSFGYKMMAVVFGSVIYRVIIALVLRMGMKSTDLKLLTAVIVAIALGLPVVIRKGKEKQKQRGNKKANAARLGGQANA